MKRGASTARCGSRARLAEDDSWAAIARDYSRLICWQKKERRDKWPASRLRKICGPRGNNAMAPERLLADHQQNERAGLHFAAAFARGGRIEIRCRQEDVVGLQ